MMEILPLLKRLPQLYYASSVFLIFVLFSILYCTRYVWRSLVIQASMLLVDWDAQKLCVKGVQILIIVM